MQLYQKERNTPPSARPQYLVLIRVPGRWVSLPSPRSITVTFIHPADSLGLSGPPGLRCASARILQCMPRTCTPVQKKRMALALACIAGGIVRCTAAGPIVAAITVPATCPHLYPLLSPHMYPATTYPHAHAHTHTHTRARARTHARKLDLCAIVRPSQGLHLGWEAPSVRRGPMPAVAEVMALPLSRQTYPPGTTAAPRLAALTKLPFHGPPRRQDQPQTNAHAD